MVDTKRVAIISPHFWPNYGTMLQAYALQNVIEQWGYKSEYISYQGRLMGIRHFTNIAKKLVMNPAYALKKFRGKVKMDNCDYFFHDENFASTWKAFVQWHNHLIHYTSNIHNHQTLHQLNQRYDLFIVGSDQTWSPFANMNYATFYYNFLCFVDDNRKKVSYAPSFGTFNLSEEYKRKVLKALKSFNFISCRETKGARWLSESLGREVKGVLDPTLLLAAEDWERVSRPMQMPEKYVLCYCLGGKKCVSDFAEKVGEQERLPVYYILTRPDYLQNENCISGVGPGEFLTLIRKAKYVCTDSFHGTIFCINFNIPFFSFTKREESDKQNDNERIQNILSEFSLENRFRTDADMDVDGSCDFVKANDILFRRRKESLEYLRHICECQL